MDPIIEWNSIALNANKLSFSRPNNEHPGPTMSSRALAIVHLAMYDAFAAVSGNPAGLPPYMPSLPAAPAGSSAAAAVAGAAHHSLSSLYPSQKPIFDKALATLGNPTDPGHGFGYLVAGEILKDRGVDGNASDSGYVPATGPGKHQPDPDSDSTEAHAPFYGASTKTFAVTDPNRHRLDPPYALGSNEYRDAVKQVREKGIAPTLMGTLPKSADKRESEETIIGIFWGYDGAVGLGTPPRLYNQIIVEIAKAQQLSTAENARLLALVNVAMADAGILAWDEKYRYEFWRPVVGLREDDKKPDSGWLPLGAPKSNAAGKNFTPPFPAYPSGHATFGAAAFTIAELYFKSIRPGIDVAKNFEFVSDEFDGISRDNLGARRPRLKRKFKKGFRQMIEENGLSRVYLGVHWSFDAFALSGNEPDLTKNIGGVPLGINIANDIFANGMNRSRV